MNKYRYAFSVFIGFIISVVWTSSVGAAQEKTGVQTKVNSMEEQVVTARKRQEDPLTVPIAITAFSAEQIQNPTVNDLSSLAALAPNIDFSVTSPLSGSTSTASVFIRGVGQEDFLLTTDPAIGIYLDGVYIARSVGGVLELADIERVEILKGPQGTLFGKNTIGGAIQVISRKPDDKWGGYTSATGGSDNRQDFSLSVEGPILDSVSARLSFLSEDRDGYAKKLLDGGELGDIDRDTLKFITYWFISDKTEAALAIDHTHQRQESIASKLLEVVEIGPSAALLFDERWITDDDFTTNQTGPSFDNLDITGASTSLNHNFSWADLISITGYRHMNADYARDPDGSPIAWVHNINRDNHWQFSQELRLQSLDDGSILDWLVGIYYFREHGENTTEIDAFGSGLVLDVFNDLETESTASFFQVIWHITQKLNLTAGLRVTDEEKEFFVHNRNIGADIDILGPESTKEDWQNISPMLSVDYQWTDNLMTFFTASRGFKSGGFNGRQIGNGVSGAVDEGDGDTVDSYDPEFASSAEVGMKSRMAGGKVDLQTSAFWTRYKDLQYSYLAPNGGGLPPTPQILNAARARIYGAEIAVVYRNEQGFSMDSGVGYLNTRYTELDEGLPFDEDNELIRAPEWTAHISPSYLWNLDKAGEIKFSINASYRSKMYNDLLNTEIIAQKDFALVDASIGWRSVDERWGRLGVTAFVTNLTDERYLEYGSSALSSVGYSVGYYGRPREWGLQVDYRF